jgi:hypothetical protein
MAISVDERIISRRGDDGTRELIYYAHADSGEDDIAAKTAVLGEAPSTYDGFPREGISDINVLTTADWEITVRYGSLVLDLANTGATLLSFSTTGGTAHITQSLATIHKQGTASPPVDAPDAHGAIGAAFGQEPSGCDIVVPEFNFTVRKKFAAEDVTAAYITELIGLTGTVNGASWTVTASGIQLAFAKGECLFKGADAPEPEPDGSGFFLTFHFAAAPNLTSGSGGDPRLTIQGLDPLDDKEGWHFLWIAYAQQQDAAAEYVIPRPIGAYVEQVYPYGDFTDLDLPV